MIILLEQLVVHSVKATTRFVKAHAVWFQVLTLPLILTQECNAAACLCCRHSQGEQQHYSRQMWGDFIGGNAGLHL